MRCHGTRFHEWHRRAMEQATFAEVEHDSNKRRRRRGTSATTRCATGAWRRTRSASRCCSGREPADRRPLRDRLTRHACAAAPQRCGKRRKRRPSVRFWSPDATGVRSNMHPKTCLREEIQSRPSKTRLFRPFLETSLSTPLYRYPVALLPVAPRGPPTRTSRQLTEAAPHGC